MNRLVLAVLFLLAAGGMFAYYRAQPNYELRRELRSLDTDLRPEPVSEKSLELGDRLLQVTWHLKEPSDMRARNQARRNAPFRYRFLPAGNWLPPDQIDEIRSIFREGVPEVDFNRYPEGTPLRNRYNKSLSGLALVVDSVAAKTLDDLANGDWEHGPDDLALAIRLADWCRRDEVAMPQFLRQRVDRLTELVALKDHFTGQQWRGLLNAIPETSQTDPFLERSIRQTLASEIKSLPQEKPVANAGGDLRPCGTFDRDDTLRHLINIRRLDLEDARLPRLGRSPAAKEYVEKLTKGLPTRPSDFEETLDSPNYGQPIRHSKQYLAAYERYARAMDAGKNTLGRSMLTAMSNEPIDEVGPPGPFRSSYEARTFLEKQRAVAAIMVFRQERGHLPATLEELVDAKILPSVPHDYLAGRPLRYSRQGARLWSVGPNGNDEDGTTEEEFKFAGDDWVTLLPK